MYPSRTGRSPQADTLALLLAYMLFMSLCAPFVTRRVEAALPVKKAGSPAAPLAPTVQNNDQRARGLLVRFRAGTSEQEIAALFESKNVRRVRSLRGQSDLELLALPEGRDTEVAAADLRLNPIIELAEPNYIITADETIADAHRLAGQWSLDKPNKMQPGTGIGMTSARGATAGAATTIIAVIDSGIDWTHADLNGNRWINRAERINGQDDDRDGFIDNQSGWDFVAESRHERDEQGHGTAQAGLIVAQGNNSVVDAGVMWRASLMSLRVLDGTGTGDVARAVEAIDYAVAHGAQVINSSWGTNGSSRALRAAIERAAARDVLVVCSAGNAGRDIESAPRYPASFDLANLLAVASVDNSDQLTAFSNWGGTHVVVAAPGLEISSAKAGGGYQVVSGTSVSAAMVSRIAGLIKALRPQLKAERTKEMIVGGARQVAALQGKVASGGVVNTEGAVGRVSTLLPGEGVGGASDDSAGNDPSQGAAPNAGLSRGLGNGQGDQFKVAPVAPVPGAPLPNLPNLDQIRNRHHLPPRAPAAVPSTRCSADLPGCGRNHRPPAPTVVLPPPVPIVKQEEAQSSPVALMASLENFTMIETLLNIDSGGGISDSPFSIKLPGHLTNRRTLTAQHDPSLANASSARTGFLALMPQSSGVDTVWVEDSVPAGGVEGSNNETWYWISSGPTPFSGTQAHRSQKINDNQPHHNHYFTSATATLSVGASDTLFTYVYLDPGVAAPAELMLQWTDGTTWYNAYFGSNLIAASGTSYYIGSVPAAGTWVRLEVPAAAIGVGGKTLTGMAFNAWNGRVFWDRSGKTAPAPPPPTADQVWVEDGIPAGGVPGWNHDEWKWRNTNPSPYSGASAHLSEQHAGLHNHYFTSSTSTLTINTGDTLFCYAYIDPGVAAPAELMLQWTDGTTWYNAYFGSNLIAASGTSYYIGSVPAAGTWVRLEVPASTIGVAGKTLSGMSFTLHGGRVTWDRAGKATPQAAPALESVAWTRMVGVTASVNNLTKTAANGWGNAGANSTKAITAGDGYMEFTATAQTTESRIAGLSRGDTDQSYQDVDFGIDLAGNGLVYLYEAGVPRGTFGSYAAGDIFRVAIEGGAVKYRKNGVLLYASTLAPSYPLLVDCALQTYYGTLNNVMIYGSLQLSDSYTPPPMDFSSARLDPINRTGTGGEDLLSGNFNWGVELVSLPGRAGLDLGLSLSYNSLVWTRSGPYITYDADHGFPSAGFRLGFPTIQPLFYNPQTGKYAYLLITPSGSRVELRQLSNSNVYESADSSYLRLTDLGNGQLLLQTTNGTRLSYSFINGEYFCTQIKDHNGSFNTVNYDGYGHISTIIDTLARTVTFNYDTNQKLQSITALRSVQGQTQPQAREVATFRYNSNLSIQTSFLNESGGPLTMVGLQHNSVVPVLSMVGLEDGSYYKFTYTSWGQVSRITRFGSDSDPNLDNHPLAYVNYDLPPNNSLSKTDCPRFTERRDWAENWNGGMEAVKTYTFALNNTVGTETLPTVVYDNHDAGNTTTSITIRNEEEFGTGWQKGLTTKMRTYVNNILARTNETLWTQDDVGVLYQLNPRVTETNVSDEQNNHLRTTIGYGNYAAWGLPYVVTEYAADGTTVLRETYTDYNLSASYLNQRLIGLVSVRRVTNGQTDQSKIVYGYDAGGAQLVATSAPATQHDASYGTGFTARGNPTSTAQYDVTDINNASKALITTMGYDTNGSIIFNRDPLGHQKSLSYTDSFSDGINRNTFAYPTTFTDADGFQTTIQYDYYLGTESRLTDAKGASTVKLYDAAGRVDRIYNPFNGAFKQFAYGSNYIVTWTSVQSTTQTVYAINVFDGAGRVQLSAHDAPVAGAAGTRYSGQKLVYDVLGRVIAQSNPTEIGPGWVAAGDDAAGWVSSFRTYDWKGRVKRTINADGTSTENTYAGCGCAGGNSAESRDEIGRREKTTKDVLGRVVKVESFNPDASGSIYSTVVNTYNALDQVTNVRRYSGGINALYQETLLGYDGYGRLSSRKLPQQTSATTFTYYADGLVQAVQDARGATTTYSYNNRHLLTGLNYSAPTGITATSPVSYGYDEVGNRTSMIDGLGNSTYHYDLLSRMDWEERAFTGVTGVFRLSYTYNLADQMISMTDQRFGATVDYNYDHTGRLSSLTGAGAGVSTFISEMKYRAWGAPKQLSYGNGLSINLSYNSRLQLTRFESPNVLGNAYDYYADGRLRYTQDLKDSRFDRSLNYDLMGRITEARSGAEARGESTPDGPYQQTYSYDTWGNLTSRFSRHWSRSDSFSTVFTNNRQGGWDYDEDGRVRGYSEDQNTTRAYKHDAAGRAVEMKDTFKIGATIERQTTVTRAFDGNGQLVKDATNYYCRECLTEPNSLSYYVRSSVLGGRVVLAVGAQAQRLHSYVYAGGELIAIQSGSVWTWRQNSPSGTSQWESNPNFSSTGAVFRTEKDAVGADVKTSDPYPPEGVDYPDSGLVNEDLMSRLSDATDLVGGCYVDHVQMPCTVMMMYINHSRGGNAGGGFLGWVNAWKDVETADPPDTIGVDDEGNPVDVVHVNHAQRNVGYPIWIPLSTSQQTKRQYEQSRVDSLADACVEKVNLLNQNDPELRDTIINNRRDVQSNELSLAHAATESSFFQNVVGRQGELGLFQIKLSTANSLGMGTFTKAQVLDPARNTQLGTTHLQNLIDSFDGDVRTALGAYKQGESGVRRDGLSVSSQEYADGILQCERRLQGR